MSRKPSLPLHSMTDGKSLFFVERERENEVKRREGEKEREKGIERNRKEIEEGERKARETNKKKYNISWGMNIPA